MAFDGRPVLCEADFTARAGEAVAVVGPSGAGKTTLLRLLAGVLRPDSGRAAVHGRDLSALDAAERRAVSAHVGFVHQDHSLVPTLRAVQNVVAGRLGQRAFWSGVRSMLWPGRTDVEQAHALLARVGIGEKLYHRTDTLSGGERQRVAIARALFQDPIALLADEPVASVDPARARDIVGLLTDLAAERGLTLVCSLHDLELARELFPRIVGLRDGRVAIDAPSAELDAARFAELYRLEGRRALD